MPQTEGPGSTPAEVAAVLRNKKAMQMLMSAVPKSMMMGMVAAGSAEKGWKVMPKAHLIVKHLKKKFGETTTLSKVGAKYDLELCVMKKDDHPKVLLEKLIKVQFKYAGVKQASISDDELVIQAIQALPASYTPTVANAMEKAQEKDKDALISLKALVSAVTNHYGIAMKGRPVMKSKVIEGSLAAVDEVKPTDKENLKRMIQEAVHTTIHEYHIMPQVCAPGPTRVGYGMMAVGPGGPPPMYNGVGPGSPSGYGQQ